MTLDHDIQGNNLDWDANRRDSHVGDSEIARWSFGDPNAPELLFVHGLGNSASIWDQVIRRLSYRYHCVAFDLPYFGESSSREPLSFELLRLTVSEILLNMRNVRAVVGHSIGGLAALAARDDIRDDAVFGANRSAPAVLAINSTLDPVARLARRDLLRLIERPLQALTLIETAVELAVPLSPAQFAAVAHVPLVSKLLLYPFLVNPTRLDRVTLETAARGLERGVAPWVGARLIVDGIGNVGGARIDQSVTFLNGRNDPLVDGFAPDLYGSEPSDARWLSREGAHWLMVEFPDTVVRELDRLLDSG